MMDTKIHKTQGYKVVTTCLYSNHLNPPQQEGEDAVQFANRVKAAIARQGGLVDLLW